MDTQEIYGGGVIPQRLRDKAQEAIEKYNKVRQQVLDNLNQLRDDPNKVKFIKNRIKELDKHKKQILIILAETGVATIGLILILSGLLGMLISGTAFLYFMNKIISDTYFQSKII